MECEQRGASSAENFLLRDGLPRLWRRRRKRKRSDHEGDGSGGDSEGEHKS